MSMIVTDTDGFESAVATVAFVDLAGFSAITDVYGDASAIAVLGHFEELVRQALGGLGMTDDTPLEDIAAAGVADVAPGSRRIIAAVPPGGTGEVTVSRTRG